MCSILFVKYSNPRLSEGPLSVAFAVQPLVPSGASIPPQGIEAEAEVAGETKGLCLEKSLTRGLCRFSKPFAFGAVRLIKKLFLPSLLTFCWVLDTLKKEGILDLMGWL